MAIPVLEKPLDDINALFAQHKHTGLDGSEKLNTSGSVTSVSVVSANGLAGTVATPSTTPAITLSTTITGLLKGNGTSISAASAGTDFQSPLSKAVGSEINTGTDDAKYATSKAIADSNLAYLADIPSKAVGSELDTGTDDAKYVTAKAIKDSLNVPSVVPGAENNVLKSDGTNWTSGAITATATPFTQTLSLGETISGASVPVPVFIGNGNITASMNITTDSYTDYFGKSTTYQIAAMRMYGTSAPYTYTVSGIRLKLGAVGNPADQINIRIETGDVNSPSGTLIDANAQTSILGSELTTSNVVKELRFPGPFTLTTSNGVYGPWIVLTRSGSLSNVNYYQIVTNTSNSTSGNAGTFQYYNGSSWNSYQATSAARPYIQLGSLFSSFYLYRSDGDDSARTFFRGFVTSNKVVNETFSLQLNGIISGFTGLTGGLYYVSNTIGTIQTTPGSTSVPVGASLTSTQIYLI